MGLTFPQYVSAHPEDRHVPNHTTNPLETRSIRKKINSRSASLPNSKMTTAGQHSNAHLSEDAPKDHRKPHSYWLTRTELQFALRVPACSKYPQHWSCRCRLRQLHDHRKIPYTDRLKHTYFDKLKINKEI